MVSKAPSTILRDGAAQHSPRSWRSSGSLSLRAGLSSLPAFFAVVSLALLFCLKPCIPVALAQVISSDVRITTSDSQAEVEPDLAIDGDLMVAVWGRDVTVRHAGWGYSIDGGKTWTDGGAFAARDELRDYIWGQASVSAQGNGQFFAAVLYQVGGFYWTIGVYKGRLQGAAFVWDSPVFAAPFGRDSITRSYEAPRIVCDPLSGHVYLTVTRVHSTASPSFEDTVQFIRSTDGGDTWSAPVPLSNGTSNGSRLAIGPDGELYVVWEDFAARQIIGRRSDDGGLSFGSPFIVGEIFDNLGTAPQGWDAESHANPVYYGGTHLSTDFPSIDVDRSQGPGRGNVHVAWTDHAQGTAGPQIGILFEQEPNDYFAGATPIEIGDDVNGVVVGELGGAFFGERDNFTFQGTEGTILRIEAEMSVDPPSDVPLILGYQLRCGEDTLQLQTIASPFMQERRLGPMPPLVVTLPRTGRYYLSPCSLGIDSAYYTLQLRSFESFSQSLAGDHRDIVLVTSRDGGATWSNKVRVNDDPAGFDNVMPDVAGDGLGQVHVVWYDRRDHPGCEPIWHTYWTESQDGGQSFLSSRRLSSQPSRWMSIPTFGFYNIGDHLAVEAQGDGAYALWTQIGSPDFDIYGAGIRSDAVGIAIPWFRAEAVSDGVSLTWMVSDASDITGFRIHRAESGSETYAALSPELLPVQGEVEQAVVDRTVEPARVYQYRLEVASYGGQAVWYGPVH